MVNAGRLSKVNHPSSAELVNRFPIPRESGVKHGTQRESE